VVGGDGVVGEEQFRTEWPAGEELGNDGARSDCGLEVCVGGQDPGVGEEVEEDGVA
jgi:hypothetical protein